jgi:hypothetical protein
LFDTSTFRAAMKEMPCLPLRANQLFWIVTLLNHVEPEFPRVHEVAERVASDDGIERHVVDAEDFGRVLMFFCWVVRAERLPPCVFAPLRIRPGRRFRNSASAECSNGVGRPAFP